MIMKLRWFALKGYRYHKKGKFHLCKKDDRYWQPICGEPLLIQPGSFRVIERKRPNMIERCSKCELKRKAI